MNMSHSLLRWLELAVLLQVRFCQERVFLEGFDPLPFCFPVPHFAYFRQVHLLMASEYSATVAGCSSYDLQDLCYWLHEDPCVDQVQHTLNAAASLHACWMVHIPIFLQRFSEMDLQVSQVPFPALCDENRMVWLYIHPLL